MVVIHSHAPSMNHFAKIVTPVLYVQRTFTTPPRTRPCSTIKSVMLVESQTDGELCILRLSGRFATGHDVAYLRERAEEVKRCGCPGYWSIFAMSPTSIPPESAF